jgi:hypothetical protein
VFNVDEPPSRRRESAFLAECCNSLGECIFPIIIVLVAIFIVVYFKSMSNEHQRVAAKMEEWRVQRVQNLTDDCVAHAGALETHMNYSGSKSFSCVGVGNGMVVAGEDAVRFEG